MTRLEDVAKAIYDEMDLTDSLALPEATRYARVAIEAFRKGLPKLMLATFDGFNKEQPHNKPHVHVYEDDAGKPEIDSVLLDGWFNLETVANSMIDTVLEEGAQ